MIQVVVFFVRVLVNNSLFTFNFDISLSLCVYNLTILFLTVIRTKFLHLVPLRVYDDHPHIMSWW